MMRKALVALMVGASLHASGVPPAAEDFDQGRLRQIGPLVEAELALGKLAGCVVAVGRTQGLGYLEAWGDRQVEPTREPMRFDTVFDLASLTKPIATATSLMALVEQGRVRLGDPVGQHLPEITDPVASAVTLEQLLTHHSGHIPDNALADYEQGPDQAWRRLFALTPIDPPGSKFVYSDVNFELLGKVVERASGELLDRFAQKTIFAPLGMSETTYLPGPALRARAAATEQRDGRWLVGEVHDPRAALLGGVAGHAGLFGTAPDLARYAAMLLRGGRLDGTRVLSAATVAEMTRARDVSGNRRALGWDIQSVYSRNRADLYSRRAFGHGGFTGTALWIDPQLDLYVIFLSTRLHPDGVGEVNGLAARVGAVAAAAIAD
ncbi:MAG: serine hydrolase domain-containing protein [Lacipirellulaceae bacterium]